MRTFTYKTKLTSCPHSKRGRKEYVAGNKTLYVLSFRVTASAKCSLVCRFVFPRIVTPISALPFAKDCSHFRNHINPQKVVSNSLSVTSLMEWSRIFNGHLHFTVVKVFGRNVVEYWVVGEGDPSCFCARSSKEAVVSLKQPLRVILHRVRLGPKHFINDMVSFSRGPLQPDHSAL